MRIMDLLYLVAVFLPLTVFAADSNAPNPEKEKKAKETVHVDSHQLLDIIDKQLQDLRAGNVEHAYLNYTSEQFRKDTSLDAFKKLVQQFPGLSQNKLFQHQSFYVDNGIATFQGDLISKDGKAIPVELDLIEENAQWKIFGIQIFNTKETLPPPESMNR